MAKGRGNGAIMQLFCMFVLCFEMARAHTYAVGDNARWTFNVTNWTYGKSFRAGDTLVFNYSPSFHNVVKVDVAGYSSCIAGAGSPRYHSGHDQIRLGPEWNYFICTFPGHCLQGAMRIALYAVAYNT